MNAKYKHMKKTLNIILVVLLIAAISSCGSTRNPFGGSKRGCPCDNVR
jgi:hypothetical protein